MAHTLRSLSTDKVVRKVDGFRARMTDIKIVDGFNVRTDDDDLRQHVASIAGAVSAGLPIPSVEVWVNPETGDIELVDGHCRMTAYHMYAESNPDFDGWVSVTKFEGTKFQRKMRIASSNKQLKLKPIELGRLYISARDDGATRQEIAAEAGMSLAHVDQMILLASAKPEVIEAVEAGVISATDAVKLAREHGDDAPAELERRKEVARELGKGKVTAKVAPKKPEKKAGGERFVVNAAIALVGSLDNQQREEAEEGLSVEGITMVDSSLLADLIGAVREMQQAGKPLDADKQQELDIAEDV